MTDRPTEDAAPVQAAHVLAADDLVVVSGANEGDGLTGPAEAVAGDVYRLRAGAVALRLVLRVAADDADPRPVIAPGSGVGRAGQRIVLRGRATFIGADGDRIEALFLRHAMEGDFILPLSPLLPRTDYTLVATSEETGAPRLADMICVAFAGGTRITLPGGALAPIEALAPGDLILTRDNGAQPVRHVARATLRAVGAFAPVVIAAGTMGNLGDLAVSPHHRLFIYQRARRIAGAAEILVQAKHLVDDDHVRRREGGFIDYLSLVFDRHEIVYAEGIPCESLLVSDATLEILPDEVVAGLRAAWPGLRQRQHFGTEVGRLALDDIGRESLYRFPKK